MNDNMTTATHMFDHSKKLAEAYEKVMQPLCKKLDMPKTALDVSCSLRTILSSTQWVMCVDRNIKAALVFHVEKLVEAGFVERQAVKGDRRNVHLVWQICSAAQPVIKRAESWESLHRDLSLAFRTMTWHISKNACISLRQYTSILKNVCGGSNYDKTA